jgi:hypothetical protein
MRIQLCNSVKRRLHSRQFAQAGVKAVGPVLPVYHEYAVDPFPAGIELNRVDPVLEGPEVRQSAATGIVDEKILESGTIISEGDHDFIVPRQTIGPRRGHDAGIRDEAVEMPVGLCDESLVERNAAQAGQIVSQGPGVARLPIELIRINNAFFR